MPVSIKMNHNPMVNFTKKEMQHDNGADLNFSESVYRVQLTYGFGLP